MEANEIKEAMAFFAIIFNRGDGFWARRWKFFELINNRGDTIIRSHRVLCPLWADPPPPPDLGRPFWMPPNKAQPVAR